jgi:hypothetical protein
MQAIDATLDKKVLDPNALPPYFFLFVLYTSKRKYFVHPSGSGSCLWIHQYIRNCNELPESSQRAPREHYESFQKVLSFKQTIPVWNLPELVQFCLSM